MVATHFVWDPEFDCITKEINAAGAVTARYTQEPRIYGRLISQHRSGATSIYHYDTIGTTRALTDNSQTVTDTSIYSGFGESVASTGATISPFKFVGALGYYFGAQTGNVDVRARVLNRVVARWMSVDPIIYTLGYLDAYRYTANQPLRRIDPSGLLCAGVDAGVRVTIGPTPFRKVGAFCSDAYDETIRANIMAWFTLRGFPLFISRRIHCAAGEKCCHLVSLTTSRTITGSAIYVQQFILGFSCTVTIPFTVVIAEITFVGYCAEECCLPKIPLKFPGIIPLPPIRIPDWVKPIAEKLFEPASKSD